MNHESTNVEYINTAEAREILKVTTPTLRSWAKQNKIRTTRTPSNIRLYNKQDVYGIVGWTVPCTEKERIVYARVSSKKQMDDLGRQTDFLKQRYPGHILVTDIGSGINWKRKGLKTILERAMSGNIEEVVVAHRDRLCRFAFELLQFVFEQCGTRLVVCDTETHQSSEQELADDLLSIVHIYSCRNMGRRRYSNPKNSTLPQQRTGSSNETMGGNSQVRVQQVSPRMQNGSRPKDELSIIEK